MQHPAAEASCSNGNITPHPVVAPVVAGGAASILSPVSRCKTPAQLRRAARREASHQWPASAVSKPGAGEHTNAPCTPPTKTEANRPTDILTRPAQANSPAHMLTNPAEAKRLAENSKRPSKVRKPTDIVRRQLEGRKNQLEARASDSGASVAAAVKMDPVSSPKVPAHQRRAARGEALRQLHMRPPAPGALELVSASLPIRPSLLAALANSDRARRGRPALRVRRLRSASRRHLVAKRLRVT